MGRANTDWQPDHHDRERVDRLITAYRETAAETLEPLVRTYYSALRDKPGNEYRKLIELTTKMTVVGHACAEIAGYAYTARRRRIAGLFGGCCFLADSFIDDFGPEAARAYLERFEVLLTEGWFDPQTERERLFYVIVSRLFAERDILDPTIRQAILNVFEAQKADVFLRLDHDRLRRLPRREQLELLRTCARNRSGHAIIALASFVVPRIPLDRLSPIYSAGSLIMHIDDHGDCYADLNDRHATYMNQIGNPTGTLRRIFLTLIQRLYDGLSPGSGRDLLIAFLTRYYLTRVEKHRQQKRQGGYAWAVYE